MSTTDRLPPPHVSRGVPPIAVLFSLTVVLTGWMLIRPHNPSLAKGFLIGGIAAVAVLVIILVRGRAKAGHSLTRSVAGAADERDQAVLTAALAVAGVTSIPLMSAAVVALGVGAPVAPVAGLMIWSQLLTLVIAYAVNSRRL